MPFPSPGDPPGPGIELVSPPSPELTGGFFTTDPPEAPVTSSLASLLALIYIISVTVFRMVHHLPNPHPLPFPPRMACCSFAQLCSTLCSPMDYSLPGSSVHGIFQAKILEWVAMPSSRGSSQLRDGTQVSCIAGGFFTV